MRKGTAREGGRSRQRSQHTATNQRSSLPCLQQKPMTSCPLRVLVRLGDISVPMITGVKSTGDPIRLIGNEAEVGLNSAGYAYHEERECGVTGTLRLTECFADSDLTYAVLGDNLFEKGIEETVEGFSNGARLLLEDGTQYRKRPRTRTGGQQDTEDRRERGNLRAPVRWSTSQPIVGRADNCNGKVEA